MKFDWKKLHVKDADVEFGRRVDALRAQLDAEHKQAVQAPMRAARKAEDERNREFMLYDAPEATAPRVLPELSAPKRRAELPAGILSKMLPGGQTEGMLQAAGELVGPAVDLWRSSKLLMEKLGCMVVELVVWALSTAVQTAILGGMPTDAQAGSFPGSVFLQHNIPTGKLLNVLDGKSILGTPRQPGMLPHPSIAVMPEGGRLAGFGNNSLVLNRSAVTPSKAAPLFPRDAYTSRVGDAVARLGELDAVAKAQEAGGSSYIASLLNMPEFTNGWEEYLNSRYGKGVLTAKQVDYAKLDRKYRALLSNNGLSSDAFDYAPIDEALIKEFPESAGILEQLLLAPSKYGELKSSADVALNRDNVAFAAGYKDPELAARLRDIGIEFVPTKSQLRTELPYIAKERGVLFKAGGGIVKKFLKSMPEYAEGAANRPAPQGALSVIKERGGNWLNGSIEKALKPLQKNANAPTIGGLRDQLTKRLQDLGLNPLRIADLSDEEVIRQAAALPENRMLPTRMMAVQRPEETSINDWVSRNLKNYIENDMATPSDPVRALAERGVLHANDVDELWGRNFVHPTGEHYEKLARTPLAQGWENATDNMLREITTGDLIKKESIHGVEPWVAGAPRDTKLYYPKDATIGTKLGFDHLVDELSNAINPASGLPQHLQFPADRLSKVSVPQAVERVAQINAWRAAQKAEADAALANNAATVLHKDYPDKGMKWVQLQAGETLPEGYTLRHEAQQTGPGGYRVLDPNGKPIAFGATEKEAAVAANRGPLADALKYEGDTMGQCVGDYCDDVASGRTRIYSLRDAKGQPHVTIEVVPGRKRNANEWYAWAQNNPEEYAKLKAEFGEDAEAKLRAAEERYPEAPSILQIKGKANRKPNDKYLPFVQDFVRSGKWSDVGDIQNTGLRRARDVFNDLEQKTLREQGANIGDYLSPDEIEALQAQWPRTKRAHGGLVGL